MQCQRIDSAWKQMQRDSHPSAGWQHRAVRSVPAKKEDTPVARVSRLHSSFINVPVVGHESPVLQPKLSFNKDVQKRCQLKLGSEQFKGAGLSKMTGVVQRSNDDYFITKKRKNKREFSDDFVQKHISNNSPSAKAAMEKTTTRPNVGENPNTVVFMNSYGSSVFCEQNHNSTNRGFASTTMFPIAQVNTSSVDMYSAAQFEYGATYDNNKGIYEVNHMFGLWHSNVNPIRYSLSDIYPNRHIMF